MLKMRLTNGDLVFGLSEANVQKLKTGSVMIFYGKTEAAMMAELASAGMLAPGMTPPAPGAKCDG